MSKDKLIYHYCSNWAFESIIRNKQLWMSDIINSNDYDEVRILIPGLFYDIEDLYKDTPFPFAYKNLSDLNAVKKILSDVDASINKSYDNGFLTSFVSCFCENGDVLSQWRGYANDGQGCSIGFSINELKKYCHMSNGVIRLEKVEYVDDDRINKIRMEKAKFILGKMVNLREKERNILPDGVLFLEQIDVFMYLTMVEYVEQVLIDSLKYKRESFCEELEWRVFFGKITKDEEMLFEKCEETELLRRFDLATQILEGRMNFQVKADCIVPYYPIELSELSSKTIKKIYVGPKNRSRKQDIKLLASKYGFKDAEICYSEISYR